MKKNDKSSMSVDKNTNKRRKFLAGITTGAAAVGMASNGKWVKPVVENTILPAHAQTSVTGDMQIRSTTTDGDEFNAYAGIVHSDGNYPITSDGGGDFNNFAADWSAIFEPKATQPVTVNLDLTVDVAGGDTSSDYAPSQTATANVVVDGAMRAAFSPIDLDVNGDSAVTTIVGTIQAEGYGTRRITYVIS